MITVAILLVFIVAPFLIGPFLRRRLRHYGTTMLTSADIARVLRHAAKNKS
jgi:hypothetical protein